jgi:hypothetical protein
MANVEAVVEGCTRALRRHNHRSTAVEMSSAKLTWKDYFLIDFGSDQFAVYRIQIDLSVEFLAAR